MLPLSSWDIHDKRVLDAIRSVPREKFLPADMIEAADEDRPLPIGRGQTISQPYIVAYMTEALQPNDDAKVLEIGTGSGYQAAVLSCLVAEVYTVERIGELALSARERFSRLGYTRIHVRHSDGFLGWSDKAPFDRIMVTAAVTKVPPALTEQLAPGGLMVLPVGNRGYQELLLIEKKEGALRQRRLLPVVFVPFVRGLD